jgi:hypothetical protein
LEPVFRFSVRCNVEMIQPRKVALSTQAPSIYYIIKLITVREQRQIDRRQESEREIERDRDIHARAGSFGSRLRKERGTCPDGRRHREGQQGPDKQQKNKKPSRDSI